MTTTPAPTALDQVRARHEVALRWLREGYSYDDNFNQAALLVRDDVPALLDELATTTLQRNTWHEMWQQRMAEVEALTPKLAAAREELAKTRAELDRLHTQVSRVSAFCQGVLSEAIAPTEYQAVMAQEVLSRLANPATTAEPAAPHCGLCGSETCPGKPGAGCMPGPFETYEPAAS